MTELTSFDIAKLRFFPESMFTDPQEIVSHRGLTVGQRLSALVSWRMQVAGRMEVPDTLAAPDRGAARDEALISRIDVAIEKLVARL